MKSVSVIAALLWALGCGGDDGGGSSSADAGPADAMADSFSTCTGPCAVLGLTASFGATSRDFERAFFGLTSPAESGSGQWELYVESYRGGEDACPSEASPSPDVTSIVSGLRIPEAAGTGVVGSSSLLDFEGALLPVIPTATATSVTVTWVAADPCVACAEGTENDRSDRFVSFDVDATFDDGTVSGRIYATHCDSLDAL